MVKKPKSKILKSKKPNVTGEELVTVKSDLILLAREWGDDGETVLRGNHQPAKFKQYLHPRTSAGGHGIEENDDGDNDDDVDDNDDDERCNLVRKVGGWVVKIITLLLLLYLFICSLNLLANAFRLVGGRTASSVFRQSQVLSNPVVGLMIGVVVTSLVQSSSTSSSIIVSMVAANFLDVRTAVPLVMGANIGTSLTNTLVSLGQVADRTQFERSFSGAVVHDMFNWLCVLVLLPLEVATGYLYHLSNAVLNVQLEGGYRGVKLHLLSALTKPFTNLIVQLDKKVLMGWSLGDSKYENSTLLKRNCPMKLRIRGYHGHATHNTKSLRHENEFQDKLNPTEPQTSNLRKTLSNTRNNEELNPIEPHINIPPTSEHPTHTTEFLRHENEFQDKLNPTEPHIPSSNLRKILSNTPNNEELNLTEPHIGLNIPSTSNLQASEHPTLTTESLRHANVFQSKMNLAEPHDTPNNEELNPIEPHITHLNTSNLFNNSVNNQNNFNDRLPFLSTSNDINNSGLSALNNSIGTGDHLNNLVNNTESITNQYFNSSLPQNSTNQYFNSGLRSMDLNNNGSEFNNVINNINNVNNTANPLLSMARTPIPNLSVTRDLSTYSFENGVFTENMTCKHLTAYLPLSDTGVGLVLLATSLVLLSICLVAIVRTLSSILKGSVAGLVQRVLNADLPMVPWLTGYLAILAGAAFTFLLQSSSIFTSTLTPLVGLGVISVERVYPLTLGSNLGTTTTALLAALASDSASLRPAIQIALVHLFFNLTGLLLWYPIPFMRIPIKLALKLGKVTAEYRWFAIIYILLTFCVAPLFVFFISLGGPVVMYSILVPVFLLLAFIVLVSVLQVRCPGVLPGVLRSWAFLPLPLRSLKPYDNILRHLLCCLKNPSNSPNVYSFVAPTAEVTTFSEQVVVVVEEDNNCKNNCCGKNNSYDGENMAASNLGGIDIAKINRNEPGVGVEGFGRNENGRYGGLNIGSSSSGNSSGGSSNSNVLSVQKLSGNFSSCSVTLSPDGDSNGNS